MPSFKSINFDQNRPKIKSFLQQNLERWRQSPHTPKTAPQPGCRTVSNNGSGSGLAPAQNILAVQVWFGFT